MSRKSEKNEIIFRETPQTYFLEAIFENEKQKYPKTPNDRNLNK